VSDRRQAHFSPDRRYRYWLKIVDGDIYPERLVMFIGLNPSTADEREDDPTIRRCRSFARSWGYNGIIMANLFAFRATDPRQMMADPEPIGPENETSMFFRLSAQCAAPNPIACWGNKGGHLNRANYITGIVQMDCLRFNTDGSPCHPLYLPKTLKPVQFNYGAKR
jgi:hypothetical protein